MNVYLRCLFVDKEKYYFGYGNILFGIRKHTFLDQEIYFLG